MNFDKKRRSRVQGGWATSNVNKSKESIPNHSGKEANNPSCRLKNEDIQIKNGHIQANTCIQSCSQDTQKEIMKTQNLTTVFPGKDTTQLGHQSKFVYQDPNEELKIKPPDIVITKPGVYDISSEPSGVSRLRYFPDFVSPAQSDEIFAELFNEVPWIQRHDIHDGKKAIQPRLSVWYGDVAFRYGGVTVEPNDNEWPKSLLQLKSRLLELTGLEFNSLVTNLYRDNHDSIGWHCDNAGIFGPTPTIASFSFGEERNFELRKIPTKDPSGEHDYTYSQVIKVPIRPGALLIMEGYLQSDWQHRVPKEYHDRGARINVTFRITSPEDK